MFFKSCAAAFMIAAVPTLASATSSVLDFDARCSNLASCSYTFDGITASLTNPTKESGSPAFYADASGPVLGSGGLTKSFDISFDQDVTLTSIQYAFVFGNDDYTITGAGVNLSLAGVDSASIAVIPSPTFLAGQAYSFYAQADNTGSGSGGVTLDSMTFGVATVPVPTSLALLGTALAGFGVVARRRRR